MRKIARETVFKLLFEHSFLNESNDAGIELLMYADDLTEDDKEYIRSTYYGVLSTIDVLKDNISARLETIVLKDSIVLT